MTLDGDGDIDVASSQNWYENDGSGAFTQQSFSADEDIDSFADIDGDGDADGIILENNNLQWLENQDGKGDFAAPQALIEGTVNAFHFSDTDDDTDQDLFASLILERNNERFRLVSALAAFENESATEPVDPLQLALEDAEALQNAEVSIPVKVQTGFESITSLSFSLAWDAEVVTYASVEADELSNISFTTNATDNGQLGITWEGENGVSLNAGSTLFSLKLTLSGAEKATTELSFTSNPIAQAATNADGAEVSLTTENATLQIQESQAPSNISLGDKQSLKENQPTGTLVGTFMTEDADDSEGFTYALVEGEGDDSNDFFDINNDELVTREVLDYEVASTYSIRVQTTDSRGKTFTKVFEIAVEDVDDTNNAPTDITLAPNTIDENNAENAVVGELSATDADENDEFTFTLIGGEGSDDNSTFFIDGNQLLTKASFDYESKAKYSIRVQVEDTAGGSFSKAIAIQVNDVDESSNSVPTDITLDNSSVEENQPANTLVGNLSATDSNTDDTHTYILVPGEGDAGNTFFRIRDNQLLTLISFDYEAQNEYAIRIKTDDGNGGSFEKALTITILDVSDTENRTPTDITLSNNAIDENQPIGTVIGTLTTEDSDSDSFTYALASGVGNAHNELFTIDGNELRSAVSFDYETLGQRTIRIQSDDGRGGMISKQFTILINDVDDTENRAPTDIRLSSNAVDEARPSGTLVGTLSVSDPDANDEHAYRLIEEAEENNNSYFSIDGDQLLTAETFDYETQNQYVIRVQADDGRGGTYEKTLIITITDTEELTPLGVANPIEDQQVMVNEPFSLTIPDNVFQGDSFQVSLTQADGSALPDWLTYDAQTNTLSGTPPEGNTTLTLQVTATDSQGNSVNDEFILSVEGVTAIGDKIAEAIAVYPVPASQTLFLENKQGEASLQSYQLLDIQGRIVKDQPLSQPSESIRIDVSSLKGGVYFLKIQTREQTYQRRVLIE